MDARRYLSQLDSADRLNGLNTQMMQTEAKQISLTGEPPLGHTLW